MNPEPQLRWGLLARTLFQILRDAGEALRLPGPSLGAGHQGHCTRAREKLVVSWHGAPSALLPYS
jgi:hypothetical protein